MRVVIFCHSLLSDWNHGNAHFLRGVCTELIARGHDVRVFEPRGNWSLTSLQADHGDAPLAAFAAAYPSLHSTSYEPGDPDIGSMLEGADLVLVHEWNEPSLVSAIGAHHASHRSYLLLFHDTHHRSVTDPAGMSRYDLSEYDGVLAFGKSVADVYRRSGWSDRVWTWHEAADTRLFRPLSAGTRSGDLVWIGNWGDDERTAELREFLFEPVRDLHLQARMHGVRYPESALTELRDAGIEYCGWTPNFSVPSIFARYRVTVHIPRRPYATSLPGVPTIRIFEALACGIPVISAPWTDCEHLFTPGEDFLVARTEAEMRTHLRNVLADSGLASDLASRALQTIEARHTCRHRVDELLSIFATGAVQ